MRIYELCDIDAKFISGLFGRAKNMDLFSHASIYPYVIISKEKWKIKKTEKKEHEHTRKTFRLSSKFIGRKCNVPRAH